MFKGIVKVLDHRDLVKYFTRGDYFGEMAVLRDELRQVSLYAHSTHTHARACALAYTTRLRTLKVLVMSYSRWVCTYTPHTCAHTRARVHALRILEIFDRRDLIKCLTRGDHFDEMTVLRDAVGENIRAHIRAHAHAHRVWCLLFFFVRLISSRLRMLRCLQWINICLGSFCLAQVCFVVVSCCCCCCGLLLWAAAFVVSCCCCCCCCERLWDANKNLPIKSWRTTAFNSFFFCKLL